jgi:hypothetical protein
MKTTPKPPQRICIYPKDIQLITGRSERYSRKLLKDIRTQLGKKDHQFISIQEFCDFVGLERGEVEGVLVG